MLNFCRVEKYHDVIALKGLPANVEVIVLEADEVYRPLLKRLSQEYQIQFGMYPKLTKFTMNVNTNDGLTYHRIDGIWKDDEKNEKFDHGNELSEYESENE